jgi:nucleolar complex protein 2
MPTEKKSFRKFAGKHLSALIETRRKTAKSRAEKKDRIAKKEKRVKREAARDEAEHQRDLDKLKDQDPEFYSYLEEDDPSLLQFGQLDQDADLVDDEDGSDVETEEDVSDDENMDADALQAELDEEGSEAMSEDDIGDEEVEVKEHTEDRTKRVSREEIETVVKEKRVADAVNLMTSAVRQLGIAVHEARTAPSVRKFEQPELVKYAISQAAKLTAAQLPNLMAAGKTPSFRDMGSRQLVKRVINASVAIMTEGSSDGLLCAQLAQSMTVFVKVMHLVRGVTKVVLRAVLNLCTHAEETTRVSAYMTVLAIAKRSAGTRSMYQSAVFKGLFLSLVRTSHKYTIHTLPVIGFLMSSVVNLYATDIEAAYQHAYVYIRQLAVHLRAALQEQSQHNVRAVFNWQFLNALRCWGLVVSTYHTPQQLGPLIHPVVQIATGLLDLFSSPRMFPMHLHVVEMLNHISSRSGVYIPVSTYLLRILSSPSSSLDAGANSAAKKADIADLADLQFSMRVKKAHCRSNAYKVQLWHESLFLLVEHIAAHSHTIGFPETFWAVASTLTKLKRETKVPKIHNQISVILGHVNVTIAQIKAKRDNVAFGPCDLESVKMFEDDMKGKNGPLVTYYNSLRQARVAAFAAKQKSLQERTTLESAVDKAQQAHKAQRKGAANTKRGRD